MKRRSSVPQVGALLSMVWISACGGPPSEPAPPPIGNNETQVTVTPPPAGETPPAEDPASDAPVEPPPAAPGSTGSTSGLKAKTAMPMEGNVDANKLVAAVNLQLGDMHSCATIIRETDKVVGSLNVQLTIAADGSVTPDLQSPVNDGAKKCLLEGMKKWKLKDAGAGKSMLLLELADGAAP